jgi:hypothetical protein
MFYRPDSVHLCAPALILSDIVDQIRAGSGGLGRADTNIYYSHKDITLGILLRAILKGDQAIGEIGLPTSVGYETNWLDATVKAVDVSKSLGGFYVGAHTDYAEKFHYFASSNKST